MININPKGIISANLRSVVNDKRIGRKTFIYGKTEELKRRKVGTFNPFKPQLSILFFSKLETRDMNY